MEELLKQLSIEDIGEIKGGVYTIDINSYDEFSAIYNKLEQSEVITKDSNESSFNMDEAHIVYLSDNYELNLNGDLDDDVYVLTIKEI
jgi:hypothetical protein